MVTETLRWIRSRWRSPVARNVSRTFGTRAGVMAIGLVISVVTSRVLGPAGRGAYASAVAVGAFAVAFGNLGLHNANTYLVAGHRERLGPLLGNTLAIGLGWGGLLGIVVYVAATVVAPNSLGIRDLAGWVALMVPAMLLFMLLENLAMGIERFDIFNRVEFSNTALNLIVTLVAVGLAVLTPAFVIGSSVVLWLVVAGMLFLLLARIARPRLSVALLREAMSYGWRPYVLSIASYSVTRMDLIVVNGRLGEAAAGEYSVALTLISIFNTFPAIVGMVLFPRLGNTSSLRDRWRLTWQAAGILTGGLVVAAGVAALLSRPAIALVYGPAFLDAAVPFRWLLIGAVLMGIHVVIVQYLNSVGCPWPVAVLWVVAALLNWWLNVTLVPRFGLVGGGWASIGTYGFAALGIGVIAWKYRPSTYREVLQ